MKAVVWVAVVLGLVGCAAETASAPAAKDAQNAAGAGAMDSAKVVVPAKAEPEYWACRCRYTYPTKVVAGPTTGETVLSSKEFKGLVCGAADPTAAVQAYNGQRPQTERDAGPWMCDCTPSAAGKDCACDVPELDSQKYHPAQLQPDSAFCQYAR